MKALDEGDPSGDHQGPEDERARDAPRKDSTLVLDGNMKLGKHDHKDKDVVDRQREFEEVRRVIFGRGRRTLRGCDPHAEGKRDGYPENDARHMPGRWGSPDRVLTTSI